VVARWTVVLVWGMAALATGSWATTWHVAKDGSGDFTVIQDAIDAASPGDVIWIHAGRYEELTPHWDVWGNGTSFADCHVVITKDDLTLQGDGAGATVIGPTEYPSVPDPNYTGISVTYNEANTLTVLDLAVENVRYGMYVASPACEIRGCRFEGNHVDGVRLFTSESCVIDGCEFVADGYGVSAFSPSANVTVSNCIFEQPSHPLSIACVCVSTDGVIISSCQITGGGGAINFQQGTTGVITNVTASQYYNYGIVLVDGGYAEVYDSRFEGGLRGIASDGAGVVCERCSMVNQSIWAVHVSSYGVSRFNDCEIINGGGYSAYCLVNGTSDCHVDMTNCYWGTDSAEQIAEWIWDSSDDSGYCGTVDFIPFQGLDPVESHTWTEVKGMFRAVGR